MTKRIEIAMLPSEAGLLGPADCYVVVDVLRATTMMAALFHAGLRSLRAVSSISAARELATEADLLVGESHGLPPEGFHLGNSPVEALQAEVRGRTAVHATTNGTTALCSVAARGRTIAAALSNLTAAAEVAASAETVCLVCSGEAAGRRFSLGDFAVAAEIVRTLRQRFPAAELGDGARLALAVDDATNLIARCEHAQALRRLGLGEDIEFALQRDVFSAVPTVRECGESWALLTADG